MMISDGARNLLENCAGLGPGNRLLVLHENPNLGYYDGQIARDVVDAAKAMSLHVDMQEVPFSPDATDADPALLDRMKRYDSVLFLARLGDQVRFNPSMAASRPIMAYTLDADRLHASFGAANYHAFDRLKDALNVAVSKARDVHVTCPLGTDFRGSGRDMTTQGGDTTVTRFPMLVYAPVPAASFSGKIVQQGFLVGSCSHFYKPFACPLDEPIEIQFKGNRITNITGAPKDRDAAVAHYEKIGRKFDIDPWYLHSWHAGIHPGCAFRAPAAKSFERWSGSAFGNPRLLHFHSCGNYPPGEISLNMLDPTIKLDGVAVWEHGQLYPERVTGGAEILVDHADVAELFQNPEQEVGLCPEGKLNPNWGAAR